MRGKQNPFASSEFVLLGFLYEKPTHGYDLHRQISDPNGIGVIWHVKMSNLYAQLEKLVSKGFLAGTIHPGETHPNRTEYHITKDGKAAFESWLNTTVQHPRDFRQEFMARFFFINKFRPQETSAFCERQLQECQKWLDNTVTEKKAVEPADSFRKMVIEFRISQIQSMVNWLNRLHNATIL